MTPSYSHKNDQVSHLLSDRIFRKLFNKTLDSCRTFHDKAASLSFLSKCLDLKIIPPTFRIRNSPCEGSSDRHKSCWTEGAKTASLAWIESTVCELSKEKNTLLIEYRSNLHKLTSPLSDIDKDFVNQLFLDKSIYYESLCDQKRKDKLTFFQNKYGSEQVLTKKKNRPGLQSRLKSKKKSKSEKKCPISVVFNYSSLELTKPMLTLLNRGLNFVVKPLSVELSKVLTDFKKFERKLIWREFFHDKDNDEYIPPVFKEEKTNLPRNHPLPKGLQKFSNTVECNLQDKSQWNKEHLDPKNSNISSEEVSALKELVKLQRDRIIVIKPCDKGSGIIVMDFDKYMSSCTDHLDSEQTLPDGSKMPYYVPTSEAEFVKAKKCIVDILKHGKSEGWISQNEFRAMDPSTFSPARFYMIYKIHKPHPPGSLPPGRPIVSGSGSHTENVSRFVDSHIKHLLPTIESYLQDTPDFLRMLNDLNTNGPLMLF